MQFFLAAFPLLLLLFLDGMGLGLVFPMLNDIIMDPAHSFLPLHTSTGTRNTLFGLIVGAFMLCWFFGAPILGDLSDKLGRKKSLLISLTGNFHGYLLTALGVVAKSVSLIVIGRMIAGFTSGSQSIAQAAIVDLSTQETKGRNIGYVLFATSIGFAVGPMIGGILSDRKIFPWTTDALPFYFASAVALLNALLLCLYFKETHVRKGPITIKVAQALNIFVSAFKHIRIRYLAVCFLVFILGWSSYYTYISSFLFKKYDLSQIEVTLFMSLLGVGFALGFAIFPGFAAKHFPLKSTVIFSTTIAALCALVTFLFHHSYAAWISVIPMGSFVSLAYSDTITLFSNQVDEQAQGWVMGVTSSILALPFGIVGLSSPFIQKLGTDTPMVLCVSFLAISAIMLSFSEKNLHTPK